MRPILCVGALTLDTIFRLDELPTKPGKVLPRDAVTVAEGMASAQAASIVRLGGSAALWASAGDDPNGDVLVRQIGDAGVDVSRVRRVAGARSGFSTILMDAGGSTIIVPQYDPAVMAAPEAAPDVTGMAAVMCDVRWPGAAALALAAARQAGIPAILDLDTGPREVLERLVPLADHVVASAAAARLLTGLEPEAAAQVLGVVTVGAAGVWWRDGDRVRHTPAPQVEAIDTLAAGDVFHAGYAVGVTEGWDMAETIRFASVAAAIKCTRFGGRLGCPTRDEVLEFRA